MFKRWNKNYFYFWSYWVSRDVYSGIIKLNNEKFKVDTIVANNDVRLIKAAKNLKPNLVILMIKCLRHLKKV